MFLFKNMLNKLHINNNKFNYFFKIVIFIIFNIIFSKIAIYFSFYFFHTKNWLLPSLIFLSFVFILSISIKASFSDNDFEKNEFFWFLLIILNFFFVIQLIIFMFYISSGSLLTITMFTINPFILFSHFFISFWFFIFVIFSVFVQKLIKNINYFVLIFSLLLCLHIIIYLNDFFLILYVFEIIFFILISFFSVEKNKVTVENVIKYFILNTLAFSLTLIGYIGLLYFFKTLNIYQLSYSFNNLNNLNYMQILLINIFFMLSIVNILFKLGIGPFYIYISDIYSICKPWVLLLLTVLVKPISFFILAKIYYICISKNDNLFFIVDNFLICYTLLNIFVGSIMSLYCNNIKRFLAYTSLNHYGTIILILIIKSFWVFIFILIFNSLYSLSALFFFYQLSDFENFYLENKKNMYFSDFYFWTTSYSNNYISYAFVFFMINLSGLPPFLFFFIKFLIFFNLVAYKWNIILFIVLFLNIISVFYYIRIIQTFWIENTRYISSLSESAEISFHYFNDKLGKHVFIFFLMFIYIFFFFFFCIFFQTLVVYFTKILISSFFFK